LSNQLHFQETFSSAIWYYLCLSFIPSDMNRQAFPAPSFDAVLNNHRTLRDLWSCRPARFIAIKMSRHDSHKLFLRIDMKMILLSLYLVLLLE
jgi:DNA mismatch repair ATPase MutL